MPIPRETGYPDYGYDSPGYPGAAHIPILFSGKLLKKFYAKTTATNILTSDYVGELKNVGDRIIIRTLPDVTIKDYKKGMTLELEYLNSDAVEFTVNRAKYFNFAMDDIDVFQSDMEWMDKLADNAAEQMKIIFDTEFFSAIYPLAGAGNFGSTAGVKTGQYNLGEAGSPVVATKDNILEIITDCSSVLDEQDIPDSDRWIVLPPLLFNLINKSDLKDASFEGGDSSILLRGGFTGKSIAGLNVYKSNLLPFVDDEVAGKKCYYIPFGWKGCGVYVSQINKVEVYRPHNTFSDACKGLSVYDFDILLPKAFGVLYVAK